MHRLFFSSVVWICIVIWIKENVPPYFFFFFSIGALWPWAQNHCIHYPNAYITSPTRYTIYNNNSTPANKPNSYPTKKYYGLLIEHAKLFNMINSWIIYLRLSSCHYVNKMIIGSSYGIADGFGFFLISFFVGPNRFDPVSLCISMSVSMNIYLLVGS